jgi:hypothetical protein
MVRRVAAALLLGLAAGAEGFAHAPFPADSFKGGFAATRSKLHIQGNAPRRADGMLSCLAMSKEGEGQAEDAQSLLNSAAAMCGAGLGPGFLEKQKELVRNPPTMHEIDQRKPSIPLTGAPSIESTGRGVQPMIWRGFPESFIEESGVCFFRASWPLSSQIASLLLAQPFLPCALQSSSALQLPLLSTLLLHGLNL